MFRRILVGIDGSVEGHRAARVAAELAGRLHATLTLVTVRSPRVDQAVEVLSDLVPQGPEQKTLRMQLEETAESARTAGAAGVDLVTLRGPVVEAILTFLGERPHDLVVVGSRGLSRGSRLLLGSVSSNLVANAPCPVLVVRHARKHT